MSHKMIKVKNRNNGYTGYSLPELGIQHRNFAPQETKTISEDELNALSFAPGGEFLLKNFLIIGDDNVLSNLNIEVEPEYYYTETEIKELLESGSLDQLEDTLNFAPNGVIDLIKQLAVDMEIPDIRKRDLISEKTGFNINSAINVNHIMNDDTDKSAEKEDNKPVRKAVTPTRKAKTIITKE